MAHSTASATSASSNTISADLPPSSMDVGRRLAAAATFTRRPVSTLPVNATLLTPGWELQPRGSQFQPPRSQLPFDMYCRGALIESSSGIDEAASRLDASKYNIVPSLTARVEVIQCFPDP